MSELAARCLTQGPSHKPHQHRGCQNQSCSSPSPPRPCPRPPMAQHPAMLPAPPWPHDAKSPPPRCQKGFPKCPLFLGFRDSNAATAVPTSTMLGSAVGTQEPDPVPASLHRAAPHFSAMRATPAPMQDLPAAPRFLLKAPKVFCPLQHRGRNPTPGHGTSPEQGGTGHPASESSREMGHPDSESSGRTLGGQTWLFGSGQGFQHIIQGEHSSGCSHAGSTWGRRWGASAALARELVPLLHQDGSRRAPPRARGSG